VHERGQWPRSQPFFSFFTRETRWSVRKRGGGKFPLNIGNHPAFSPVGCRQKEIARDGGRSARSGFAANGRPPSTARARVAIKRGAVEKICAICF